MKNGGGPFVFEELRDVEFEGGEDGGAEVFAAPEGPAVVEACAGLPAHLDRLARLANQSAAARAASRASKS